MAWLSSVWATALDRVENIRNTFKQSKFGSEKIKLKMQGHRVGRKSEICEKK